MLFISLLLLPAVTGLNYDPVLSCPVSATPCHCSSTEIDCVNRGLTEVPTFKVKSKWHFKSLKLGTNNITTLRQGAFQFANVSQILLDNNAISSVHRLAFNGTAPQTQVRVLDLQNNKLSTVPPGIGDLNKLEILDVKENPIQASGFGDEVMRKIGDTINEFHFGFQDLQEWPKAVRHLAQLKHLICYGGNMSRLPIDAFHGFEWTLKTLWIENTKLIATPIALQDLHSLDELHFNNNPVVGDSGILPPAFTGLTNTLNILTMENNNLTQFPRVLVSLSKLHNLSIADNDLQFISDSAIGNINSNLTMLNLQRCNLDRIPGAIVDLTGIETLDLRQNHIQSIERNDFYGLQHLAYLDLSQNPLRYVSKSAFRLNSLKELILMTTELLKVPEALKNLPNLIKLDMSNIPEIECDCNTMVWLYHHMKNHTLRGHAHSRLEISGDCYTIKSTIEDFVETRVNTTCLRR